MRLLVVAIFAVAAATPVAWTGAAMLTEEVCAQLARQERAGNVAYQPGVTVRDGKVAPANVRPADDLTPRPTVVDISVLLKDRYVVSSEANRLKGEVPVSRFFVRSDGGMNYAGQPLTAEDQQQVSLHCLRAWGRLE